MPRDHHGCGFYRMFLPASKLKDLDLADVMVGETWSEDLMKWCDIMVVQRPSSPIAIEYFAKARAIDKRVVIELDDLLWGVSPENAAWKYWNPIGQNLGIALELLRQADAVTTTTARLANEYVVFNKNIYVLPNYLDGEQWDHPVHWTEETHKAYEKKRKDKHIRIGFSGSYSHVDDIELIKDIMVRVVRDFPNVIFVCLGFNPLDFFAKMMVEAIKARKDMELPIQYVPGKSLLDYPDHLMAQAFDIGIAPLVERGFNEARSDLKLKEYGAVGIPTVASNIRPYRGVLQEGKTGYLVETGKEWYEALKKLIENKKLREEMGRNAHQFYEENRIDNHIQKWVRTYQKIRDIKYTW